MIEEQVPGARLMRFLYFPAIYPVAGRIFYKLHLPSEFLGRMAKTGISRHRINNFIKKYDINMEECVEVPENFSCFNDFFIRRLRPECRPWERDPRLLAAPADCRALLFPEITREFRFSVKGMHFSLPGLLGGDDDYCRRLDGGSMLICRLAPVDCHRFYFPADGSVLDQRDIPGALDSVHPFALSRTSGILAGNSRCVSLLALTEFGITGMIEVGAFAVGSIVQSQTKAHFSKMEEKGWFDLGGSTILLIFERGRVEWDSDLRENYKKGLETKLCFGERLGRAAAATDS